MASESVRVDLTREYLSELDIAQLPPETTELDASYNQLSSVPPEISILRRLRVLELAGNNIAHLPPEISKCSELTTLDLRSNRLTSLPPEVGRLENLRNLLLDANPISSALRSVLEVDTKAVQRYLLGLLDSTRLDEAKLILVGEGGVGKSSILAALAEEEFVENRPKTHALDTRKLTLTGTHVKNKLTMNCFDFGGQAVYRTTSQLYYSPAAVYLVVWNSRLGAEQSDVGGWVRRIRLRAGSTARVVLVATHSDEHTPRIDLHRLRKANPDLQIAFEPVDCKSGSGIDKLSRTIADLGVQLPHVGQLVGRRWLAVREHLESLSDEVVDFARFTDVCLSHGLDHADCGPLAQLLHDLGSLVYFGNMDPGLADLVVLQPEWLTRAIGLVLNDSRVIAANGVLRHVDLERIWIDEVPPGVTQYPTYIHPFLVRLMERFDVSYRLTSGEESLIAELVQEERPARLHNETALLGSGLGRRRTKVIVRLDEDPPPGFMAWLIVRTRQFALDDNSHWQHGVALEHSSRNFAQTAVALIELIDRQIELTISAPWPPDFLSLLLDIVERLLVERWPGLRWRPVVPCPGKLEACSGTFPLTMLRRLQADQEQTTVTCQDCVRTFAIESLLAGLTADEGSALINHLSAGRLDLESLLSGIVQNVEVIGAQLDFGFRSVMRALESEGRMCPRMFTVTPLDQRWRDAGRVRLRLNLWCEMPAEQHPTCPIGSRGVGEYELRLSKEWLVRISQSAQSVSRLLRVVSPVFGLIGSGPSPDAPKIAWLGDLGVEVFAEADRMFDTVVADVEAEWGPVDELTNRIVHLRGNADALRRSIERRSVRKRSDGDAELAGMEQRLSELTAEIGRLDGELASAREGVQADSNPVKAILGAGEVVRVLHTFLGSLDPAGKWGGLRRTLTPSGEYLWLCETHFRRFVPEPPAISYVGSTIEAE